MSKPKFSIIRGLGNDLPPKWDGHPVTWDGWEGGEIFICPPPTDQDRACAQCGVVDSQRKNMGRTFKDGIVHHFLHAKRCRHCNHDTVYDLRADKLWDLDPSDYSDEGSYEIGQGALL